MKLETVTKGKDMLEVEVDGETHTLLNILRENAWKAGADQASYFIDHPYLSEPHLSIRAKNPKKVLMDAAELLITDAKTFQREFKRVIKK